MDLDSCRCEREPQCVVFKIKRMVSLIVAMLAYLRAFSRAHSNHARARAPCLYRVSNLVTDHVPQKTRARAAGWGKNKVRCC